MSTAVSGDDRFKPGDKVMINKFVPGDEPERIQVTIIEPLFGGFYQVGLNDGQQMLMHDPDDNPVKLGVEDTHKMPMVTPKVDPINLHRPKNSVDALAEPPVPEPPIKDPVQFGMSSPDLAVEVANVVNALSDRVLGPGKEQYEHTDANGVVYQNFETMDLPTLVLYAREEVQDIIVYMVMLDIRLRRLQAALKAKLPPEES